jgi:hypothetical protein
MSPISPLLASYQASGAASDLASPTSGSVVASTSSCEATEVTLASAGPLPQPTSQPEPGPMSGRTA